MPRVVHFDIKADEPKKLKRFFEETFDWRFDKWEDPNGQMEFEYYLIDTGGDGPGIDGGLTTKMGPDDQIDLTIAVSNIDEYVEKIEQNGGKITSPKMAIPEVGWIVNFEDPQGNKYLIMEDDPKAK